jgi:hypothetical protein
MSDMARDDEPREQKHGPSILAAPIARRQLETREEGEAIVDGV